MDVLNLLPQYFNRGKKRDAIKTFIVFFFASFSFFVGKAQTTGTTEIKICVNLNCEIPFPPGFDPNSIAGFGDFNGGNQGDTGFSEDLAEGEGIYCKTITDMPLGMTTLKFRYNFAGGASVENLAQDLICPTTVDGFRTLNITGPGTLIYDFNGCENTCTPPPMVEVNVCVDVSCLDGGFPALAADGDFTGFNPNAFLDPSPMGNGIFCKKIMMFAGERSLRFQYNAPAQTPETLDPNLPCVGTANGSIYRIITVTDQPDQSFTFGWNSCDEVCTPPPPPPPGPDFPITFEDSEIDYQFRDFGGASSERLPDPTDPSNTVVCTNRPIGAAFFAGTAVADISGVENPIPFTETEKKISVRVWSPTANTPVLLKVENVQNAGIAAEVVAYTTVSMQWETLVFDFENSNPAINLAFDYGRIVIFFDFEPGVSSTDPATTGAIYYWDDITMCVNTCPPGATVACLDDLEAITDIEEYLLAGGDVSGGCYLGTPTLSSSDEEDGDVCPGTPEQVVTRTYVVTTESGVTSSCEQEITVENNTEDPTIAVVEALTSTCYEGINPNPAWATVTAGCGVDYEVTVTGPAEAIDVDNCPGYTYTYTYTITDECDRSASATQVYTIENDGPTMECPDNCEVFGCYDGDYEAVIEAWLNTVTASSSCSDALYVGNNYNGIDGICVGDFTEVRFYAEDACEREVECFSGIYIIDTDAPEIIGEPTEPLVPCTANTEQTYSDWLANHAGLEAYDACWEDAVSWSYSASAELNCAAGPQAIMVEFTATDGCGNEASVSAVFSTKLLPNVVNVAGLIQTEAAEPVEAVQVAAYQSTGMTEVNYSNESGDYQFEELPFEENTEIVPNKNDDYLNGVSTYDLILLQQHIIGIEELDSPYKKIAADANRSGTISTLDLVLLRRLILHIDEELADNTSWRFIDADFVFPTSANPFETEFPEMYNLSGEEEDWASFVAVKIGDFNLDAETNNLTGNADDRSGLNDLIFEIEDQKLQAGEEYSIAVSAQNFAAIRGFQMTLDYDHSLISILDVQSGDLPKFSEANYNLAFADAGTLPMSWNDQTGQDLRFGDAAFRIIIKANADVRLSEVLTISSSMTKAEAYGAGELMNVDLNFIENGQSIDADNPIPDSYRDIGFQVFQNQPNPFKAATLIGFQLPEAGEVSLEIYNVAGKLLHVQRASFAQGFNQFEVSASDLPHGVLYYHVNTATDSDSKKMILIK